LVTHERRKAASVVGLGYVGFPLACLCAEKGYRTFGIDSNPGKIELIQQGISPFQDPKLQEALNKVKFIATTDFQVVRDTGIVVVCVPTPIDHKHNPDFKPLEKACRSIKKHLRRNHLIIIESTVNPGACEEVVQPILEESGLKAGIDFDFAHCPERIDPGNKKFSVKNIPGYWALHHPKG